MQATRHWTRLGTALIGSLALAGCGGGSSTTNYNGSTVVGQVLMGPAASGGAVNGGGTNNICAYALVNGQGNPLNTTVTPYINTGTVLDCVPTAADGSFSMDLTSFYGPVLLQVSGGTFGYKGATYALNSLTSTALGLAASASNAALATNASLEAMVNVGGGGTVHVMVTPLTTFAVARITPNSGQTMGAYATSLGVIAQEFGLGSVDLTAAVPAVAPDPYGMALLGVDQYLATMTPIGSSTNDPYAANFLTWNNLAQVSADYTAAYNAANGTSGVSFSFQ
jgi:hypothetical protein